jgi:hypothetical protein
MSSRSGDSVRGIPRKGHVTTFLVQRLLTPGLLGLIHGLYGHNPGL